MLIQLDGHRQMLIRITYTQHYISIELCIFCGVRRHFYISGWSHILLYTWMSYLNVKRLRWEGVSGGSFVSRLTHDEYEHGNNINNVFVTFLVLKIERIMSTSFNTVYSMRDRRHLSHVEGETCHPCTDASILHSRRLP